MFTEILQLCVFSWHNKILPRGGIVLTFLGVSAPHNMFCFVFLFGTGNYMEGSKKVESIFLSQLEDLLSGPDFDMCPLAEKPRSQVHT